MSIINAIVAPFEAAAEIATAIDTVATALDGARTVVLILENTTHHALERGLGNTVGHVFDLIRPLFDMSSS